MSEETQPKAEEIKKEDEKTEKVKIINAPIKGNKSILEEIDISADESDLIKKNVSKMSQLMQILGQTTEQYEIAKENLIAQIGKCREEHERVCGLVTTKNGFDAGARVVDVDYDKKKMKISGSRIEKNE